MSNIVDLMLKDHLRLLSLLTRLERTNEKDVNLKYNKFETFKWEVEKHFFLEEKTIFSKFSTKKEGVKIYNLYIELVKQHEKILNLLDEIKKQIMQGFEPDIIRIRDLLINHQKFEEKLIYPKLDEELDENEKIKILNRIEGIIQI